MMHLSDIAKVRTRYLTGESARYCNDPEVEIILKRDRRLIPWKDLVWHQSGQLFWSIQENEVHYLSHNKNDHNGFGWARYALKMADGEAPDIHCSRTERDWGNGSTKTADCHYDAATHTVHLVGPWHCGAAYTSKVIGIDVMDAAVLEGPSRYSISHPDYHARMKRQGRAIEGTMIATCLTVEFLREAVDTIAPEFEICLGDYGWTVKFRDMPPKNPRKLDKPIGDAFLSGQQAQAVYR